MGTLFQLSQAELTPLQILTIRDDPNAQDWKILSAFYDLTEDFCDEFHNHICWNIMTGHQAIPITILDKFSHKFNQEAWRRISSFQDLSKDFIQKYAHKLSFDLIILNTCIQNDIKDYCKMFI